MKKLSQKQIRTFNILLIILMLLMLLFCMVMLFVCHVARNAYIMLDSAVLVIGMVFCVILYICCAEENEANRQNSRHFILMILLWFAMAFSSTVSIELPERIKNYHLCYVLNTISYILTGVFWIFFWFFLQDNPSIKWRKRDTRIVMIFAAVYFSLVFINIPTGIFFSVTRNGDFIQKDHNIYFTLCFAVLLTFYGIKIVQTEKDKRFRWTLLSYCLFPAIAVVFNFCFIFFHTGEEPLFDSLTAVASLLSLYTIFINLYAERGRQLLRQEKELTEKQTRIMLTQIQPHFIFNALSTISSLCRIENAADAQQAVDKFADYLRMNLDSLSNARFIPFAKELEHTKTYLWLESMRFGSELELEYDIQYDDFRVPALTLQPLAENAVKHGLSHAENGGKLTISTRDTGSGAEIVVHDNGVGFDPNAVLQDGRSHIGLENIRNRLEVLCGGTLTVESAPGEGTTATISLP